MHLYIESFNIHNFNIVRFEIHTRCWHAAVIQKFAIHYPMNYFEQVIFALVPNLQAISSQNQVWFGKIIGKYYLYTKKWENHEKKFKQFPSTIVYVLENMKLNCSKWPSLYILNQMNYLPPKNNCVYLLY